MTAATPITICLHFTHVFTVKNSVLAHFLGMWHLFSSRRILCYFHGIYMVIYVIKTLNATSIQIYFITPVTSSSLKFLFTAIFCL